MGSSDAPGEVVRGRRAFERNRMGTSGELVLCPGTSRTQPIPVRVEDCSTTGIGIVHDEPLPRGQKFVIREPTLSNRPSVLFTVVRCDELASGRYSVGLHASHLMSNEFEQVEPTPPPRRWPQRVLLAGLLLGLGAAMYFGGFTATSLSTFFTGSL